MAAPVSTDLGLSSLTQERPSAGLSWARWPKSPQNGAIRRVARPPRRWPLRPRSAKTPDRLSRTVRRCTMGPGTLSREPNPLHLRELMARVTVEDCVTRVPNRFNLILLAANRARAIAAGGPLLIDRDNDKNPVVALREIADDMVNPEELRETLITSLQRVDEHSEAEEEAETLALLADPTHSRMSEQELVRALQSDRDCGQEERY